MPSNGLQQTWDDEAKAVMYDLVHKFYPYIPDHAEWAEYVSLKHRAEVCLDRYTERVGRG